MRHHNGNWRDDTTKRIRTDSPIWADWKPNWCLWPHISHICSSKTKSTDFVLQPDHIENSGTVGSPLTQRKPHLRNLYKSLAFKWSSRLHILERTESVVGEMRRHEIYLSLCSSIMHRLTWKVNMKDASRYPGNQKSQAIFVTIHLSVGIPVK